jgi:hypothetical protein
MKSLFILTIITLLLGCGEIKQQELVSNFNENRDTFVKLVVSNEICPGSAPMPLPIREPPGSDRGA